jgi:hypothetical protein
MSDGHVDPRRPRFDLPALAASIDAWQVSGRELAALRDGAAERPP